ncbi:MAG: hypothetical protein OCD76_09570 [Reichenbachiella sp.]
MNVESTSVDTDESNAPGILENRLIDTIIRFWVYSGILILCFTLYRTVHIGFQIRDVLYVVIYLALFFLYVYRKSISPLVKANSIIGINSSLGIISLTSFGMESGGVFLLIMSGVIAALFYRKQSVNLLNSITIILLVIIGYAFIFNYLKGVVSTKSLASVGAQWAVYIVCFSFILVYASYTVFHYRKALKESLRELESKNEALNKALEEVATLNGLLPICASCKNIRDDSGYWNKIEVYVSQHSSAEFSHAICPSCATKLYPEYFPKEPEEK